MFGYQFLVFFVFIFANRELQIKMGYSWTYAYKNKGKIDKGRDARTFFFNSGFLVSFVFIVDSIKDVP